MLTKVCKKCGVEKTLDKFYKHKTGKQGVRPECAKCKALIDKEYRQSNQSVIKEKKKEYYKVNQKAIMLKHKIYRDNHIDDIVDYKKKHGKIYREINKEAIALYGKAYRDANKQVIALRQKQWNKNNPDRLNVRSANRRARKLMATPVWADQETVKGMYQLVSVFNRTGIILHVDHIVPLQSDLVCGLHCEANLQLLPASDNQSKGNRHWPDMW
jgi:hypothetical protein